MSSACSQWLFAMARCGALIRVIQGLSPEVSSQRSIIDDQIRAGRIELGLVQKQAADQLGASVASVLDLEKDRSTPSRASPPRLLNKAIVLSPRTNINLSFQPPRTLLRPSRNLI